MDAIAIRDVLRNDYSDDLDRRRKIICLSAIGLVDFSIISLYQTGVIIKLPDPPLYSLKGMHVVYRGGELLPEQAFKGVGYHL